MDGERFVVRVAAQQGVGSQGFDGLVQQEGVGGDWREGRPKFGGTLGEDLFGDSVSSEEGAEAQQVGGGWLFLLDALKGEGPGGGDRLGMIIMGGSSSFEQGGAVLLVTLQVIGEATACLFQVCARLIERQGQFS